MYSFLLGSVMAVNVHAPDSAKMLRGIREVHAGPEECDDKTTEARSETFFVWGLTSTLNCGYGA